MAEKEFSDLIVDSCGLGDWHVGELPDERMRESAQKRGVILTMRARQVKPSDFDQFDYVLAASKSVVHDLYIHAKTPEQKNKIKLITAYSKNYHNQDIPDPYYKDAADFDLVLDMLEDSCQGFIEYLKKHYLK